MASPEATGAEMTGAGKDDPRLTGRWVVRPGMMCAEMMGLPGAEMTSAEVTSVQI